jgi:hypothetical protein
LAGDKKTNLLADLAHTNQMRYYFLVLLTS